MEGSSEASETGDDHYGQRRWWNLLLELVVED